MDFDRMTGVPGTMRYVLVRFFFLCMGFLASILNARSGYTVMMVLTSAVTAFFVMQLIQAVNIYFFARKHPDIIKKTED